MEYSEAEIEIGILKNKIDEMNKIIHFLCKKNNVNYDDVINDVATNIATDKIQTNEQIIDTIHVATSTQDFTDAIPVYDINNELNLLTFTCYTTFDYCVNYLKNTLSYNDQMQDDELCVIKYIAKYINNIEKIMYVLTGTIICNVLYNMFKK